MLPLLLAQLGVTSFLCGLSWTIRGVHYPLFARVGREQFAAYEREHQQRVSRIVAPAMLFELLVASLLLVVGWKQMGPWIPLLGLSLVLALWILTWRGAVPCHRQLEKGFDGRVLDRLLRVDRWRVALWSTRTLLGLWMLTLTLTGA